MSLTSYRAAPPRVNRRTEDGRQRTRGLSVGVLIVARFCVLVPASGFCCLLSVVCFVSSDVKTWQRPTLPRLETEYHWRGGFSRPSSGWDRVWTPRYGHQVVGSDDVVGYRGTG